MVFTEPWGNKEQDQVKTSNRLLLPHMRIRDLPEGEVNVDKSVAGIDETKDLGVKTLYGNETEVSSVPLPNTTSSLAGKACQIKPEKETGGEKRVRGGTNAYTDKMLTDVCIKPHLLTTEYMGKN